MTAVAVIKLWLVRSQSLTAMGGAVYDDRLFLNAADALMKGNWLGPYTNLTLAKGPFYPIWIATMSKVGVPLLLSQHLLYIASCVIFVIAVKPLMRRPFTIHLVFIALLFNPMSYSQPMMTQVMREGIYPSLTLLVFSCAVGLLVRANSPAKTLVSWAAGLGFVLPAFLLTREEGIWIAPSLIILAGGAALMMRKGFSKWKILSIMALPVVLCGMIIGGVAGMNAARYGIFTVNELKSPDFLAAYGALLRVTHDGRKPAVPVPREVRSRIYAASPAFAELRPFLEGDLGKRWLSQFEDIQKYPDFARKVKAFLDRDPTGIWSRAFFDNDRDLLGSFFIWAFREAVAAAGYHSAGSTAAAYYRRLAAEVNAACAEGRLSCLGERSSLMPPWRNEYAPLFLETFACGALFLVRFEEFNARSDLSIGDEKSLRMFRDITHERLSVSEPLRTGRVTRSLSDLIGKLYHSVMPSLIVLSLIAYAVAGISAYRKRQGSLVLIIATALAFALFARLTMLSLIQVTSFPAILVHYVAPSYPLLISFVAVVLTDFCPKLGVIVFRAKKEEGT